MYGDNWQNQGYYNNNSNRFLGFVGNKKGLTYLAIGFILVAGSIGYFVSSRASADINDELTKNSATWSSNSYSKLSEFKNANNDVIYTPKGLFLNVQNLKPGETKTAEAILEGFNSNIVGTTWESLNWLSSTPAGTSAEFYLRAADDPATLGSSSWAKAKNNGSQLYTETRTKPTGQFADIKIVFSTNSPASIPLVFSATADFSNKSFQTSGKCNGQDCNMCRNDNEFSKKMATSFKDLLVNYQASADEWKKAQTIFKQSMTASMPATWKLTDDLKTKISNGPDSLTEEDIKQIAFINFNLNSKPIVEQSEKDAKNLWAKVTRAVNNFTYTKQPNKFGQATGLPALSKNLALPSTKITQSDIQIFNDRQEPIQLDANMQIKPYLTTKIVSFYEQCDGQKTRSFLEAKTETRLIVEGTLTFKQASGQNKVYGFNFNAINNQEVDDRFNFILKKEF